IAWLPIPGITIAALSLWGFTLTENWSSPGLGAPVTSARAIPRFKRTVVYRTPSEVWKEWHQSSQVGPAETIVFVISGVVFCCCFIGSLLHVPNCLSNSSIQDAFGRSARTVTGCLGVLCCMIAGVGSAIVATDHAHIRRNWPPVGIFMVVALVPSLLSLLMVW